VCASVSLRAFCCQSPMVLISVKHPAVQQQCSCKSQLVMSHNCDCA